MRFKLCPDILNPSSSTTINVRLFTNVKNSPDLVAKILAHAFDATFVRAELVPDIVVLLAAANQALFNRDANCLHARMVKAQSILDKSLSKGKTEINLSTYATLFAEMVVYIQQRVTSVDDLHNRLASLGRSVGLRMIDLIVFREKGYKRETRLLGMLMFIKSTVWKNLFGKEADRLERSNDDPHEYLLIEKEPLVNTFISISKDKPGLNCAAFIAGMVEAILEVSNFPCKVSVHWHEGGSTLYFIKFDESVISRENVSS